MPGVKNPAVWMSGPIRIVLGMCFAAFAILSVSCGKDAPPAAPPAKSEVTTTAPNQIPPFRMPDSGETFVTEPTGDVFVIWNFDKGLLNVLGGINNALLKEPSNADAVLTRDVRRGAGGRALRIDFDKQAEGYCGWWMHLFHAAAGDSRTFLAAEKNGYRYLSFWVRGAKGGEQLTPQLADALLVEKEDSVKPGGIIDGESRKRPLDVIGRYLPKGITREWQEVVIPLDDYSGIDADQLGSMTITFLTAGAGSVFIDDVALKKKADLVAAVSPADSSNLPAGLTAERVPKATWMWHTKEILHDTVARAVFVRFCRDRNITDVFLQLMYRFENEGTPEVRTIIEEPAALGALMKDLHAGDIRVHALDGYGAFCLAVNHPKVLSQVRAILDFNSGVSEDERWDGIHLDNEPHTLPEWQLPAKRPQVIVDFYRLNKSCMELIAKSGQKVVYGIDVSFWLDEFDGAGKPNAPLVVGDVHQPLIYHLIDIVDNIGIMAYRTTAHGVDGTVNHSIGEVKYASARGKRLWVGLESDVADKDPVLQRKLSFKERSITEMNAVILETAREFWSESSFAGLAIHHYKSYRELEAHR